MTADGAGLFVLGNASIDVTLNVPRLPAPGETLMARGMARAPGGKGLNQAVVAARAGARVRFCAPVGGEPETGLIHAALAREAFADVRMIVTGLPTDLSTLIVAEGGENCIISTGDSAEGLTPYIARTFVRPMRERDWLLVQGNLSEAATWAAVGLARNVVFNTAPIRWVSRRILEASAVVVANEGEAREITGRGDVREAAVALGGKVGIVTLGGEGCVVAEGGVVRHFPVPALAGAVVDTTGAGDVFCGVLAAGLAGGMDVGAAVRWGQRAASVSVTRAGCFAGFPAGSELLAWREAGI